MKSFMKKHGYSTNIFFLSEVGGAKLGAMNVQERQRLEP